MSATMTCTTPSRQTLPVRENRSLLARLAAAIVREFRVRRDMRLLTSFDEAALHDIGLTRSSLEGALRHGRSEEHILPALDNGDPVKLPHSLVEWR